MCQKKIHTKHFFLVLPIYRAKVEGYRNRLLTAKKAKTNKNKMNIKAKTCTRCNLKKFAEPEISFNIWIDGSLIVKRTNLAQH